MLWRFWTLLQLMRDGLSLAPREIGKFKFVMITRLRSGLTKLIQSQHSTGQQDDLIEAKE